MSSRSISPSGARWAPLVCLAALAFYLGLVRAYPALYWYDAPIRLALRDQPLLGSWLPLLQMLIFAGARISGEVAVLRAGLALIAVGAVAAAYRCAARWFGTAAGWVAALWLASNFLFAGLATTAYSEVLFIGLALFGLSEVDHKPGSRRWLAGALAISLACLTRYEGWLLALILIGEAGWQAFRVRSARPLIWAIGGFGLAPLAWLLTGIPVGPPFALLARLQAIVAFETGVKVRSLNDLLLTYLDLPHLRAFIGQYLNLLLPHLRPEMLLLAAAGLMAGLRSAAQRPLIVRLLIFLPLSLLLGASGAWEPDNLRQMFNAQVFITILAAAGLVALTRRATRLWPTARWLQPGLAVAITLLSARAAAAFVAGAATQPEFALPARAGEWLRANLPPNALVLSLTGNASQPYDLALYSGLPLAQVLAQDRFTPAAIEARIAAVERVYIVALPPAPGQPLSPYEASLLMELNAGRLADEYFDLGAVQVWMCRSANWYSAEYSDD